MVKTSHGGGAKDFSGGRGNRKLISFEGAAHSKMGGLSNTLGPMRIPFLILTPSCVLLGVGSAVWTSGEVNLLFTLFTLIGALSAHISVNSLNEYFDYQSGLDLRTKRTPFSGGSGVLPERPHLARHALAIGVAAFALTAIVGVYFVFVWGWLLLPLGLMGLFVIFFYTTWFTSNPVLCLIAPGLGFGTLMVMGTDFVLTGSYSSTAFAASMVPFFLVSNLLLLNQFPDVKPDKSVGRRHFPIILGARRSSLIYAAFLLLTYVSIALGVHLHHLPRFSLMGLATIAIAVPAFAGAYRYGENIKRLMPYLGLNVVVVVLTPLLVAAGLFLG
jgi:1,4-dihydroxy-2-naphthoate octaprenyltransferase